MEYGVLKLFKDMLGTVSTTITVSANSVHSSRTHRCKQYLQILGINQGKTYRQLASQVGHLKWPDILKCTYNICKSVSVSGARTVSVGVTS